MYKTYIVSIDKTKRYLINYFIKIKQMETINSLDEIKRIEKLLKARKKELIHILKSKKTV